MTTVAATGPIAVGAPTVLRLAVDEARRLLRHPVMLIGFGLWVAVTIDSFLHEIKVVQASEMIDATLSFFPGVPAVLAAHLVATRDRRAGTLDLLATTPARAEERVRALCLAPLAPALVALLLNTAVFAVLRHNGEFAVTPPMWHVVQAPLTVLGGGLLGMMVGVWAPTPVAPVLAIVGMVGLHVAVAEKVTAQLFAPLVQWASWGIYDGSVWVGWFPGSSAWHVVYVVGLCGLAAGAALLRVAERRGPAVLVGITALALAVVGGVGQLP